MKRCVRWCVGWLCAGAWCVVAEGQTVTTVGPPRVEAVLVDAPATAPPSAPPVRPLSKPSPEAKESDEPQEDEPAPRRPAAPPPPDPRYMRLHMLDGSVIAGKLSITELPVDTEYGKLSIPISSIRSFIPGLGSHPQVLAEIEKQIGELGSEDFKAREQAHRELSQRGVAVKRILEQHLEDASAEQRRHLQAILKEFEEQDSSSDEESAEGRQPWIVDDTIVTQRFTVVGRITRPEFQIDSKYGPLTVKLLDVVRGEREVAGRDALRKTVTVLGNQLVQRGFKSSGIRVEAGDKVTIRAQGSVTMTPWGGNQMSSPDGGQQYGWYVPNEISGGTLIVKIGDGGKVQKAGSRSSFVAKASGVLQFAIAMQADFAQEGYQFPGQYEVTVKVEPK